MGAFGLNASIMDASNLAWKMGLACQGRASIDKLMATYNHERREHACRIIETSGEYLRFVCNAAISIAHVRNPEELSRRMPDGTSSVIVNDFYSQSGATQTNGHFEEAKNPEPVWTEKSNDGTEPNGFSKEKVYTQSNGLTKVNAQFPDKTDGSQANDLKFLASFFGRNGKFLLGVDAPFESSVITPLNIIKMSPVRVKNGVRAPNPRVCFSINETGYLYDKMTGAATFHLVLFASSLRGRVRKRISSFANALLGNKSSFYYRYGCSSLFNIIVVLKCFPDDSVGLMDEPGLDMLRQAATVVYDDRAPDEDAHTTYGVDHGSGAVVVVRPDLWIGTSALPDDNDALESYFDGFLLSSQEV